MSVFVLSAIVNIADQAFCIPFYGKEPMSKNPTQKSAPTKEKLSFPMTETHLQAPARVFQEEDAALKTVMQFFAEEVLPFLHISGKVVGFAPTELVRLDIQKFFQDFNLIMEDTSWKHFEFQSTDNGIEDLKRFRVYEAVTSYQNGVSVTTYVLYSGNIRHPVTQFTEGINTYRVQPIIMQNKNAEKTFQELKEKAQAGRLTRTDLVSLTLCPLMGGEMPQKERIKGAFEILKESGDLLDPDEVQKIEAVIYAMAEKFLEKMDLEEVMEEISMTRLGEMLVNKGYDIGHSKGVEEEKLAAARNLLGQVSPDILAKALELPLDTILKLEKERESSSK